MSPEKQHEKALFEGALDLTDPDERRAFLDRSCGEDTVLRVRLEKLLAAQESAEEFLTLRPQRGPESAATGDPAPEVDDGMLSGTDVRIGRYKLLQRLGEGGCGVVYLAEQQEPVRREVALKIIRMGISTPNIIARFQMEQQAMAWMEHPNIARVLDAGATATGRPYFVMEWVRGTKITDYCNEHRLDTNRRLDLFIQVCNAIQHAHQKGVIHRDIKPSNILVALHDGQPVPKVIDFGISKSIEEAPPETTETPARVRFIGTPAYMSPEQAEPEERDVDTRSDIYGLGALLYELLTGRPPFDSKGLDRSDPEAVRRAIRERPTPPPPSALVDSLPPEEAAILAGQRGIAPRAWLKSLRGDLDSIVLRALAPDRRHRYETAHGLARDIRRYLDHEPVVARPPNMMYHLGKWIRRYRVAFIAGTSILLALVGGLGTSTWLYLRERAALQEQTRLRAVAEDAEKISNAVFLARENRMEEANALLSAVRHPPARPSLEGVTAYRAIGSWLGSRQRWAEAADRFAVVDRVGRLDSWMDVTIDHQAYSVVLLLANDLVGYETFRHDHAERFTDTDNADAGGRVLKMCLLRPPDTRLQQRLHPLGERVARWVSTLPNDRVGWASIPVALWRYRQGDIPGARQAAALGYKEDLHSSALTASKRVLLALCALSEGHRNMAAPLLATAQTDITAKFTKGLAEGSVRDGYWYDWAFAKLLLNEANAQAASMR